MTYLNPITALKAGKKISKKWWDKGSYVFMDVDILRDERGEDLMELGRYGTLLSDDWEIYEEPHKTMTFMEAVEYLKNNMSGSIKRKSKYTHKCISDFFSMDDITATDWVIAK